MSRASLDIKILYIAPWVPYPLTSGMALRQFHILRAYAAVGRVTLVAFDKSGSPGEGVETLRQYCEMVFTIPESTMYRRKVGAGWRARLEMAASPMPDLVRGFQSREIAEVVKQLTERADLLHVAKLWMVPTIHGLVDSGHPKPARVLDLDDVESVVRRRALAVERPERWQRRVFERYDQVRLWLYERMALKRFDRVLVCSERDRRRLAHRHVVAIPNGAELPSRPLPEEADGRTLLCAGSLGYRPNVEGLLFFVRDVLPLIRREVPGVRLLVAGRKPADEVLKLQQDHGDIQVVADPPTLEPYYTQATAAVVSLRIGGGTRLRILEAFAWGRPVVSTSVGCEGLEVTHGEHLLVSDDPQGLATSCVSLLKDPTLRRRLVARGRELVEQKYTWDSVDERVKMLTAEVLAQRRE